MSSVLTMSPPRKTPGGSGVARTRFNSPISRRNGVAIARFTKHAEKMPNAMIEGTKYCAKRMSPRSLIRSFELSDAKITRNMIGNTNVKIALVGLRQKRFCSSTSWSPSSADVATDVAHRVSSR